MRRILVLPIIFLGVFVWMGLLGLPASAQFQPLDDACQNVSGSDICDEVENTANSDPVTGPDGIIIRVANFVAIASGVIAVFVLMVAGIQMITSNGDAAKVKASRDAIIYTAIGVVVVVFARTIVVFIINQVG